MPALESCVEVRCGENSLLLRSTRIRNDGLTVELDDEGLAILKRAKQRGCTWIDVLIDFSPLVADIPLSGSLIKARMFHAEVQRRGVYSAFFRFMQNDGQLGEDIKSSIALLGARSAL